MINFLDSIYRNTLKKTDLIIPSFILSFLLTLIGLVLTELIFYFISINRILDFITGDAAASDFAIEYLVFLGIWLVVFYCYICFQSKS